MAAQITRIELEPARAAEPEGLSPHELYRLTLYKWRYSLEAAGFAPAEVANLLFLKWLQCTRRVMP